MKIAMRANGFGGDQARFLVDCPANTTRGLDTTSWVSNAKTDFTDQASVDAWVAARSSLPSGTYKLVDLGAAGIQL